MGKYLDKIMQIEGMVSALEEEDMPEKIMFLTSHNWGLLADEIISEGFVAPGHVKPTPQNFTELIVSRRFKVVNSGTEDQEVVDEVNRQVAEEVHFAWKRDHLITGRKNTLNSA